MATKHDAKFYKVATNTFADLRRQYKAIFPLTDPKTFSELCAERAPVEPGIMDWLSAASMLVKEAEEDQRHWAEEFEEMRMHERACKELRF